MSQHPVIKANGDSIRLEPDSPVRIIGNSNQIFGHGDLTITGDYNCAILGNPLYRLHGGSSGQSRFRIFGSVNNVIASTGNDRALIEGSGIRLDMRDGDDVVTIVVDSKAPDSAHKIDGGDGHDTAEFIIEESLLDKLMIRGGNDVFLITAEGEAVEIASLISFEYLRIISTCGTIYEVDLTRLPFDIGDEVLLTSLIAIRENEAESKNNH